MVASGRWQTTAAAATAVTLAALPVAYFAWQRSVYVVLLQRMTVCCLLSAVAEVAVCALDEWTDRQRKERQQALKLLRRVELIVAEVSVRLTHLANQVEDAIANEGWEGEEVLEPESSSSLNSCECNQMFPTMLLRMHHYDSKMSS